MYFLNINKPKNITSFDVIKILRKKLNIKAIGHSGTLDPLASGVMQVAIGSATKLLDYLESDKTYIADIKFGFESTTMDEEGEKTFISNPNFSENDLINVLNSFIGVTKQIPPKFSAIKQNGKKLCDIARKNPDIEILPNSREIEIYSIELLNFKDTEAQIKVHCKKGTYIRSLAHDIGLKLKCGAYISDLKRIKAGNFYIESSDELDSYKYNKINPLDVLNFEKYELDEQEYQKIKNGCYIKIKKQFFISDILLTKNNKLVSLAKISDNSDGCIIKPKKNFNED